MFIAACPTTEINKAYIKRQLAATLAGRPPPDYQCYVDIDETAFKGYVDHSSLGEVAKQALGYGL